jgi:regulatory protein YycI of two-component signal transduction system YycFG
MKKVTFNKDNMVYTIPEKNNCILNIWYAENELINFKKSAINEILELMKRHNSMTCKDALKLLYQPGNICYDKNNFE